MLPKLAAVSSLIFVTACASLSEDSCRTGNWESIGYSDGVAGRSQTYIEQHREACAEYGIAPDTTKWLRARIEGLKQYCTRPNAYEQGRRGNDLNPVCSSDQSGLQLANFYGMRYHEITRDIDRLDNERDELLRKLAHEFNDVMTPEMVERKRFYLSRVRRINSEIRDLEWELRKYDEMP